MVMVTASTWSISGSVRSVIDAIVNTYLLGIEEVITLLPVILAGGVGTRLWPISFEDEPKQLLRLPRLDASYETDLSLLEKALDVFSLSIKTKSLMCLRRSL